MILPVKGSPHINAARLWTAWYATEGAVIATQAGENVERGWPDSNSFTSRKLAELKGDVVMLSTQQDLERADRVRAQIVDEYKRMGVR